MPRRMESLFVAGPAGKLEALLEEPEDGEPREAALVCHPHPLHGGTMHNKVVHRLARGLRRAGCVVLRFNFRGVNLSEGVHDNGAGELEDARAALKALRQRHPKLPYTLAGFSFGSRVAAVLARTLWAPPCRRVILAGTPTRYGMQEPLAGLRVPRIFLQSTHDKYGPREELQVLFDALDGPKEMHWVEARDHFFSGALAELEETVRGLS